jgi:hypothetical protein
MAKPSPLNPLRHIIERQYKDNVFIKNKIFKERLAKARNLYRKDLLAHYGCVNAIEFSAEGDLLVSGMSYLLVDQNRVDLIAFLIKISACAGRLDEVFAHWFYYFVK